MDAALRDLERRWRESGAADDQAAWLAAAVRAGVVDAGLVRLAAELGHPAARLAGQAHDPAPVAPVAWLDEAVDLLLERQSREEPDGRSYEDHAVLLLRAGIAAARALAPAWYRHLGGEAGAEGPLAEEALSALRAMACAQEPGEMTDAWEAASALAQRMGACVDALEVHDQDVEALLELLAAAGDEDALADDRLERAVRAGLARGAAAAVRGLLQDELGAWLIDPRLDGPARLRAPGPARVGPRPGEEPDPAEDARLVLRLREAIEGGRLHRSRVELAAWLGHPAARQVYPDTGPLASAGRATIVRALVALARATGPGALDLDRRAIRARKLRVVEAWLADPSPDAEELLEEAGAASEGLLATHAARACLRPTHELPWAIVQAVRLVPEHERAVVWRRAAEHVLAEALGEPSPLAAATAPRSRPEDLSGAFARFRDADFGHPLEDPDER